MKTTLFSLSLLIVMSLTYSCVKSSNSSCSLEPEMVFVKGGTFIMGATSEQGSDAWDSEKPTHSVTLSDYYIGKYEVTKAQWEAVMGNNTNRFRRKNNRPVDEVSWYEVQIFIQELNQLTGKQYRLPTEAEWEYAARGGAKYYNLQGIEINENDAKGQIIIKTDGQNSVKIYKK